MFTSAKKSLKINELNNKIVKIEWEKTSKNKEKEF